MLSLKPLQYKVQIELTDDGYPVYGLQYYNKCTCDIDRVKRDSSREKIDSIEAKTISCLDEMARQNRQKRKPEREKQKGMQRARLSPLAYHASTVC